MQLLLKICSTPYYSLQLHSALTKTKIVIDQIPKSLPLDVCVKHLSLTKSTFVIDQIYKGSYPEVCCAFFIDQNNICH